MKDSTDTVLDKVISSYSSSVKALLYGRRSIAPKNKDNAIANALLVAMQNTPDQSSLHFAADELRIVEKLVPALHLEAILPRQNNRQHVLDHLKASAIFHFAGHGQTNPTEPSQSCLLLEDWQRSPLTMDDLRDLRLSTISGSRMFITVPEETRNLTVNLRRKCQKSTSYLVAK